MPLDDPEFWAWFAGFWEGEGSLSVKIGRYHRLVVTQKNPLPLMHIKQKLRVGNIHRAVRDYTNNNIRRHSEIHFWQLMGVGDILEVVEQMYPHLRSRREEVAGKIAILKEAQKWITRRRWKDGDEEFLIANHDKTNKELAKILGRNPNAINQRLLSLGFRTLHPQKWTTDELDFLKYNLQKTDKEIARELGRSHSSILHRRVRLGLAKYVEPNSRSLYIKRGRHGCFTSATNENEVGITIRST